MTLDTVEYSPGRTRVAATGLIIVGSGMMWLVLKYFEDLFSMIAMALIIVWGVWLFARSFFPEAALTFDQNGFVISTFDSKKRVDWADLIDVTVDVHTVRLAEIIPIYRVKLIHFSVRGGIIGNKLHKINASMLELGGSTPEVLRDRILHLHMTARAGMSLSTPGKIDPAARARYEAEAAPRSAGFDPDDVMDCYLRNRDGGGEAGPAAAAPARPQFGRKAI